MVVYGGAEVLVLRNILTVSPDSVPLEPYNTYPALAHSLYLKILVSPTQNVTSRRCRYMTLCFTEYCFTTKGDYHRQIRDH